MRKSAALASVAAGLVLLAAVTVFFSSRGRRGTTPPAVADRSPAARAEDALVAPAAAPPEARSAVDDRASASPQVRAAGGAAAGHAAAADAEAKPTARIVARVLDLDGAPIEGAALVAPLGAFTALPPAWAQPKLPVHARSDADGRLEAEVDLTGIPMIPSDPQKLLRLDDVGPDGRIELPAEGSARGAIAADGFVGALVWVKLRAGESFDLGELRLAPGARVRGRVLTADGAPVAGAEVRWSSGDPVSVESLTGRGFPRSVETGVGYDAFLQARSAPDGSFELPGAPLREDADTSPRGASGFLIAKVDRGRWGVSEALSARPVSLDDVVIRLPPAAANLVRGRVLRPDGLPAPNALVGSVMMDGTPLREVTADASGRFEYPTEPPYGVRLAASDPSGAFYSSEPRSAAAGDSDVVLTLVEGAWVELRLVSHGRPVPNGAVRTWDTYGSGRGVQDGWPITSLDESGRKRLLLPREPFRVEAQAPGFVKAIFGPFDPGDPAELGPTLVLELEPGAAIRGTVVAGGKPVAGARVGISLSPYPVGVVTTATGVAEPRAPFDLVGLTVIDDRDAVSGSDGAFVAPLPGTGNFTLSAEAPGWPPRSLGPFAWTSPDGASGLVIELARGGALAGRVIPPAGESPAGRVVAISNGTGQAWTQTVGGDGAYRFDDLPPGGWQVRQAVPPVASRAQMHAGGYGERREPAWDVVVAPDGTARFDLDLSRRGRVRIVGSLRIDGAPAEWATVSLHRPSGDEPPRIGVARGDRPDPLPPRVDAPVLEPPPLAEARLDAQGRFALDLEEPGDVVLELRRGRWSILRDLSLAEGESSVDLALETGSLRMIDASPEGSEGTLLIGSLLLLEHPSGARIFCELDVGRLMDGDEELAEDVPAGALAMLQARDRQRHPSRRKLRDAEAWQALRSVVVPAGGEARLEFR